MKTIIIEDVIYKVTEKEFKVIKTMESEAKQQATLGHKQAFLCGDKLMEYLDSAKRAYRFVGIVDFHTQR